MQGVPTYPRRTHAHEAHAQSHSRHRHGHGHGHMHMHDTWKRTPPNSPRTLARRPSTVQPVCSQPCFPPYHRRCARGSGHGPGYACTSIVSPQSAVAPAPADTVGVPGALGGGWQRLLVLRGQPEASVTRRLSSSARTASTYSEALWWPQPCNQPGAGSWRRQHELSMSSARAQHELSTSSARAQHEADGA